MIYTNGRCIKINTNTTINISISIISNDKHIDNNNFSHCNEHKCNDKMANILLQININTMIIITIIIIIMIDNHICNDNNNMAHYET